MIEAALRVLPDDAGYLALYGSLLCRAQLYEQALDALSRSNARYGARGIDPIAENWAFIAIASHHLNRRDEARSALERLRSATETARDPDALRLLRSVEALLED
jgi:hypothetical protein